MAPASPPPTVFLDCGDLAAWHLMAFIPVESVTFRNKAIHQQQFTDRSTIAEHVWAQDNPINWSKTRVPDCAARATEGGSIHPDDL